MELLAPAGSMECLVAAVQNGADAVYLAGQQFGARHSAQNFSNEEIAAAVDYAHEYGVKIYVTVNTQIKEKEYSKALAFVSELYRMGVDAILVQDTALGAAVKQKMPAMHVHASTQMSVHDIGGARYLQSLGFERVVLARELSYEEILAIRRQTDIELEVFAHGALCMCYSGQCYMSSFMGGRSGNRGRCAQPCRLPYELWDGPRKIKSGHLLSPKDLSLAQHLAELDDKAFDSLKIEGRLKSPLYVATVCRVFSECLRQKRNLSSNEQMLLEQAFCRSGFTDGYFVGKMGAHMMSYETPTNTAFYQKGSLKIEKLQKELANSFAPDAKPIRRVPIFMNFTWQEGKPLSLTVKTKENVCVSVTGELPVEKAQKSAMDFSRVADQLKKTGATPFAVCDMTGEFADGLTLPVREMNAVRRRATDALSTALQEKYHREPLSLSPDFLGGERQKTRPVLTAEVTTLSQFKIAKKHSFARIYVPEALWETVKDSGDNLVLKCPDIVRQNLPKSGGKLIGNIGYLPQRGTEKLYGDFRLGIFNSQAVNFFAEQNLASLTLSIELSKYEMQQIIDKTSLPLEAIVYGKLPLMMMRNCPFRAAMGRCSPHCDTLYLKDRRGEKLSHTCEHKICTLINAKPLYVADAWQKCVPENLEAVRLWFTDESDALCEEIITQYERALSQGHAENVFGENAFTRGHFLKGVL